MSLHIDHGEAVASIIGTDNWVGIDMDEEGGSDYIKLNDPDQSFMVLPFENKRTKLFVAGPTGCGKTHFVMQFLDEYKKIFPENTAVIITADPDDPTIHNSGVEGIQVFDIKDPELRDDKSILDPSMFHDAIVFVDDVDFLSDKAVGKRLKNLTHDIIGVGRHFNSSIVQSKHILMNGHDTKFLLGESDYIVVFPRSGTTSFIDRFFRTYFSNLSNQIKKRIWESKSRWAILRLVFPQLVILENEIYML